MEETHRKEETDVVAHAEDEEENVNSDCENKMQTNDDEELGIKKETQCEENSDNVNKDSTEDESNNSENVKSISSTNSVKEEISSSSNCNLDDVSVDIIKEHGQEDIAEPENTVERGEREEVEEPEGAGEAGRAVEIEEMHQSESEPMETSEKTVHKATAVNEAPVKMETENTSELDESEKCGLSEEEPDTNKPNMEVCDEEFKGFPTADESLIQGIIKQLSEKEESELLQLEVLIQNTDMMSSPPPKRRRADVEESDLSSQCSSPALSISSQLSALSFSKRSRTGSPASRGSRKSNVDLSNPKYMVPFEFGWRREVVTRGITSREDGISKDVYYFHPSGKKLRSLREVSEKLTPGVTIENFTFYKEPLGADPKYETIRNARSVGQSPSEPTTPKISMRSKVEKSPVQTPPPKETTKGVTPLKNFVKTPKEAIPKPLPPPPPAKREKLVLKFNKGTPKIALKKPPTTVNGERKSPKMMIPKLEGPKPHPNAPSGPRRKITPRKKPLKPQNNKEERRGSNKSDGGELEMGMLPPMWSPTGASAKTSSNESLSWSHLDEKSTNEEGRLDPCTIRCTKAMGLIPTLQCSICLCLYHPECCDMGPISSYRPVLKYVCKNCQSKASEPKSRGLVKHITPAVVTCDKSPPIISPKPIHPVLNSPATPSAPVANRLPQMIRPKIPASKSGGGSGMTTWLPPTSTVFRSPNIPKSKPVKSEDAATPPQAIVNMNSKRYIVVPKNNVLSVASNQNSSPAKADPAQNTTIITPTPTSTIIQGPPLQSNPFIQPTPHSPGVLLVPYMSGESMSADSNSQCLIVNPVPGSSATSSSSQPDLPIGSETPDHFTKRVDKNAKKYSTDGVDESMQKFMRNICIGYTALLNVFQYLKVQELLRAGRVCRLWRDIAGHSSLWRTVRMKNSQVCDWKGFTDSLSRHGTKHLDLRKMLVSLDETEEMWKTFSKHISSVKCLERLDMCRCSVNVIEQITEACPHLLVFNAQMIGVKDQTTHQKISLDNLSKMKNLRELRMKSFFGLHLVGSLRSLTELSETLTTLSLTSVKNLGSVEVHYIGRLSNLEALELGECTDLPENFPGLVIAKLLKLKRIRLEKGPSKCSANEMLHEMSKLKDLMQLELINFDIRPGFDEALASCANIKRLLLIPTYVTQSATTNNIILSGAFKLWRTLTHFVWVVTMELLKVTELFVDQCEGKGSKKSGGNSVPVLKPVPLPEVRNPQQSPDATKDENMAGSKNPTPITVIPIDELFEMLREALPNTRVKLLKIPFQSTWRQSITEGSSSV